MGELAWIDRLTLTPREPVRPYDIVPVVSASVASSVAANVLHDTGRGAAWRAPDGEQTLVLDFRRPRVYGGLIVYWEHARRAADYDVQISHDGESWQTVRAVRGGAGARDYIFLPETESRWLRVRLLRPVADEHAITRLAVQPLEWAASRNTLFESIAADAPRGHYPKYLSRVPFLHTGDRLVTRADALRLRGDAVHLDRWPTHLVLRY
jgi:hypothetical protein